MMFHGHGDHHPDWYLNLEKHPHVTVEADVETYEALATPLTGADRVRTWVMLERAYPFFAEYKMRTARVIPVVALTRAPARRAART